MPLLSCRALLSSFLLGFYLVGACPAQTLPTTPPLASGEVEIRGSHLSIYRDEALGVDDAEQTINIGERATVRTCFGGATVPCGSLQAGDPRLAGLTVLAELAGPELPDPLPLATVPGGSFILPSFQQNGDYTLENIRLVSETGGSTQVVALAEPSLAVLHVRKIVLTSASVRALTLEELRERGVQLNEENFQAFDFAVGFAFGSEVVEISFPVTFEGKASIGGYGKPEIKLDDLPPGVVAEVARWTPPSIVPFRIVPQEKGPSEGLEIGLEEVEELDFPVYGVIVLPGTVTYLNQFFDASLMVANGAPAPSGAVLRNLRAAIRLPGNQALRLARTEPPVSPGQEVPVLADDGGQELAPGEKGKASWTVEGLKPGTHGVVIDLEADLYRPGRDPLPVASRCQAAVEVVDARFHLTFSHPDVVREGEAYTLFVTVANESLATQNLITLELLRNNLSGAHPLSPDDDLKRPIASLRPGESETVEFELVADVTGQAVATTFQSDSAAGLGTIQLRAGVGELGIPLSPATLVLPRYSEQITGLAGPGLLRANNRLLGLAYSLAVAPASALPPGLGSMAKADVERRARDLGEAGQRIFLGDSLLRSVAVLALDQLGNRADLSSYDQLRRLSLKGLRAGGELAKVLRAEQERASLSAVAFFDRFAETASYADPFLAAVAIPTAAGGALDLEIRGKIMAEGRTAYVGEDESRAVRTLPYGEIFRIHSQIGVTAPDASFGLVGRVAQNQVFTVEIANPLSVAVTANLQLMIPEPAGRGFRRVDFGVVSVPAGGRLAVDVGGDVSLRLYDPLTQIPRPEAPATASIPLPPFTIIGVRQEFKLVHTIDPLGNHIIPNRYGNGLTYLFNRPPAAEIATHPEAWRIVSTFDGKDVLGAAVSGSTDKLGDAVYIQDDGRVVNVRYSGSISPLLSEIDGTTPLVQHQHLLDSSKILDRDGEPVEGTVPPIQLERAPHHIGGLVGGRVLRGNGSGAANARVQLIRQREFLVRDGFVLKFDETAETVTDGEGNYFFDFIELEPSEPVIRRTYLLRATVPAGDDPVAEPADVEQVGSIVRLANRMARINIALLGRGAVFGHLKYADNQQVVAGGKVEAASTLFSELKSVDVGVDGSFRIEGVAVGPITLTGRDPQGRTVYATVEVARSGAEVEVQLRLLRRPPPGLGTVRGKVVLFRGGVSLPAPGAVVACYVGGELFASKTTGEDGSFVFPAVPAGQITLQAADFRVSRTAVLQDDLLPVGGTVEALLRIPESVPKTVAGQVWMRNLATGDLQPLPGATVYIEGPGTFTKTDSQGRYVLPGVPSQAAAEQPFAVTAIDLASGAHGSVTIPKLLEGTEDPILATTIVLETGSTVGGVRGRVVDHLGHPKAGVEMVLYPLREGVSTGADGTFFFPNVPGGSYEVVAHVGDGLESGPAGAFGKATVHVSFPGHQPFVEVPLVGAGTLRVHTKTSTSTGILTPIYYRATYYSYAEKNITLRGHYIESSTNPAGYLELPLPVGDYEIVAYNPFHGTKTLRGRIDQPGQVVEEEIVFEDAGKVRGQVVGPDGITPVPFAEVVMRTGAFLPQTQLADALGRFEYFLVPRGPVALEARGEDGAVERVGSTLTYITLGGQEIDVQVQLKRQGTVHGRVVEIVGGHKVPVSHAQYAVFENSYPFRRFPADGTYYVADEEGQFEVSHLFAGAVTVVGRDPLQVDRSAQIRGEIVADWQRLDLPDIELAGGLEVGRLVVLVRDPATGVLVPDAQVKLSNGEMTVSDAEGRAVFEALRLGAYSVYVFHAPTGRSGRQGGLQIATGGQEVDAAVDLEQRGRVSGTVWDSAALTTAMPGAVVELRAQTAGGLVVALATARTDAGNLGRFEFLGIPEGSFQLTAADPVSPRRGALAATLTPTSPEIDVNIILEPLRSIYVRLYEKLRAGMLPVDTAANLFSVRLRQGIGAGFSNYDFTRLEPESGGAFFFPDLLLERSAEFDARELTGDQRVGVVPVPRLQPPLANLPGAGTAGDPFRLTLAPKGVVEVQVNLDTQAPAPAGITVRLGAAALATNSEGKVTFVAVPAGSLVATATHPFTRQAGYALGNLVYDDETVTLTITLSAAVSVAGTIYQPAPEDQQVVDPSVLPPMAGAVVELRDAGGVTQVQLTDAAGRYHFDALKNGPYSIVARSYNGEWEVSSGGNLQGTGAQVVELPALVLDGSPPRLVEISPLPGAAAVAINSKILLTFNERLHDDVVAPSAIATFFSLRKGSNVVGGVWTARLVGGRQQIEFLPSEMLDNFTVYSISIRGGAFGVKDRQGRILTTASFVGSSFRTKDSVGPEVASTLPRLDRPVDPETVIRLDFNEKVSATPEMLDGDGFEDAALMQAQRTDGVWVTLPIVLYLTRSDFSLQLERFYGIGLPPEQDSGRRRLTVSRLTDATLNAMVPVVYEFRLFDENPPVLVALPLPADAPDGNLYQGATYVLTPVLEGLDDVTPTLPGGDLDRVEYYFDDPDLPNASQQAAVTVTSYPFAFQLTAPSAGAGPRPFPVWARAFDTSLNVSVTRFADLRILPNAPPAIGQVTLAPAEAALYPGDTVVATAGQFSDADGSTLTLTLRIRRADNQSLLGTRQWTLSRPAGGWAAAAPQSFSVILPDAVAEGTPLEAVAEVIDRQGTAASATSALLLVADDQLPPQLSNARIGDEGGFSRSYYELGAQIQALIVALDAESRIKSAKVSFEPPIFGSEPLEMISYPSPAGSFRLPSPQRVMAYLPQPTQITATFRVEDLGGNVAETTALFEVRPSDDPTPPALHWTSPFEGGQWPAAYHTLGPVAGVPLLLQIAAFDEGWTPPGSVPRLSEILRLEVRTSSRQPDGSFALDAEWRAAEKVAGGADPSRTTWQLLWRVPDDIPEGTQIPFEARAWNTGGHLTVTGASLLTVPARKVYENVNTAVPPEDPMTASGAPAGGPVFLLSGSDLSLFPQPGGAFRQLPSLFLYAGGERAANGSLVVQATRLTTPEITTLGSTVLYNPLELEISGMLGVGGATQVDLKGRGLLGGTVGSGIVEATLPGIRGAGLAAGGSHGGSGLPGYRFTESITQPGEVYDDLRHPHLPGGGGRSEVANVFGGGGGGVIRIAGGGSLQLEGELLANAPDGGNGPGGAGGAIDLELARLGGWGRIDASGGVGPLDGPKGYGGGGRIAIRYRQLASDFDFFGQVLARGGGNLDRSVAGAGTIYREQLPETGSASGLGTLQIVNGLLQASYPPQLAFPTPLPGVGEGRLVAADPGGASLLLDVPAVVGEVAGESLVIAAGGADLATFRIVSAVPEAAGAPGQFRVRLGVAASSAELEPLATRLANGDELSFRGLSRFLAIVARGSARVYSDSDLELGPAGALNDRAFVEVATSSRVLLRGEGSVLTPVFPAEVTTVRPGQVAFRPDWDLTNALGLRELEASFGARTVKRILTDWPAAVSDGWASLDLSIPVDATPGPIDYRVEATDLRGRKSTWVRHFEILADEPPTLTVLSGPTSLLAAGPSGTFQISVADVEGLASIGCELVEPTAGVYVSPTSPKAVSGTSAAAQWNVLAVGSATVSSFELRFWVQDLYGQRAEARRTVQLVRGAAPTGSLLLLPAGSTGIEPGLDFQIQASAADGDGDLEVIRAQVSGPVSGTGSYTYLIGNQGNSTTTTFYGSLLSTAQPGATITVTGEVQDRAGNVTSLMPLSFAVLPDTTPPSIFFRANSTQIDYYNNTFYAGRTVELEVTAGDNVEIAALEGEFLGQPFQAVADSEFRGLRHVISYEVPADLEDDLDVVIHARALDAVGNVAERDSEMLHFRPERPPTFTLTLDPGTEVAAGTLVTVTVEAQDDQALTDTAHIAVTGPGLYEDAWYVYSGVGGGGFTGGGELSSSLVGPVATKAGRAESLSHSFLIPASAFDGAQYEILVEVEDLFGHRVGDTRTLEVTAPNTIPPVARIYLQPAATGDRYPGGQTLTVIATARGIDGATPLTVQLPGRQLSGQGYAATSLTLPEVAAPTPLDVAVTTVDGGGLTGAKTRRITVLPPESSGKPWVRFDCPSSGALLPAGDSFTFTVTAGDDLGVVALELRQLGAETPPWTWQPNAAPTYTGTAVVGLGAVAGTRTYEARATDGAGQVATATIEVEVTAAVELDAVGPNDWSALENQVAVLRQGTLALDQPRHLGGLIVLGGNLTHPPLTAAASEAVDITADGAIYIACGAAIDVSGSNSLALYGSGASASTHVGRRGGQNQTGSTYGSLVEPGEAGNVGSSPGGGVVHLEAARLVIDGAIEADGATSASSGAGAGGSIWLVSQGPVAGAGSLSAQGGGPGGGGGAIAIHGELTDGLEARSTVAGGSSASSSFWGGPGSLYVKRPGAPGRLVVRGPSGATLAPFEFPRLASGSWAYVYDISNPGDSGGLEAHLAGVQPWVRQLRIEVRDWTTTVHRGFYQASWIEADHFRIVPEPGAMPFLEGGDEFRSYQKLDELELSGALRIESSALTEPLSFGSIAIDGRVEAELLRSEALQLRTNSVLLPPLSTGSDLRRLAVAAGDVVLEPGAKIDANGRGTLGVSSPTPIGGNHLGIGDGSTAGTFDAPDFPRAIGAGGNGPSRTGRGGGAIELDSEVVYLPAGSSVTADGDRVASEAGGAGGSVLIQADTRLHLDGTVRARGGDGVTYGGGGGGAVALHYDSFSGSLAQVDALGGRSSTAVKGGGAGAVVVWDRSQPLPDLIVDNGDVTAQLRTALPGIGQVHLDSVRYPDGSCTGDCSGGLNSYPGTVLCGYRNGHIRNSDGVWVSDLYLDASAVGRLIEISGTDPYTGLPGEPVLRRIAAVEGPCAGLEIDPDLPPVPDSSNVWQGIYAYRDIRVRNAEVAFGDPVRGDGQLAIEGVSRLQKVAAGSLELRSGATLKAPAPASSAVASLPLQLAIAGELRLQPGAQIDVSGQGLGVSYSAATGAAGQSGPSHIGVGGGPVASNHGKAYGSVYLPAESGAGRNGTRGGGVVAIQAGSLVLEGGDSVIRANGSAGPYGGAGGTVDISAGSLGGLGKIEARGGASDASGGNGSAGGGAISLRYDSADPSLLARVDARGGAHATWPGGPGSILLYQEGISTFGSLVLDNGGVPGIAELPAQSSFAARDGSEGNVVRYWVAETLPLPTTLERNWFRVQHGGSTKGCVWVEQVRPTEYFDYETAQYAVDILVSYLAGRELTLETGDTFAHIYPLDSLTYGTLVSMRTAALLAEGPQACAATGIYASASPAPAAAVATLAGVEATEPSLAAENIGIEAAETPGLYRIRVPPLGGARFTAAHLLGRDLRVSATFDAQRGAVLLWPGRQGEVLRLELDAPAGERRSLQVELPALPEHPLANSEAFTREP